MIPLVNYGIKWLDWVSLEYWWWIMQRAQGYPGLTYTSSKYPVRFCDREHSTGCACIDARRGVEMFRKVLGVVQNMSCYVCPNAATSPTSLARTVL
eukprot:Em0484g7a